MPAAASVKPEEANLRNTLLSLLSSHGHQTSPARELKLIRRIHAVVITSGLSEDSFLLSSLLHHSLSAVAADLTYVFSLFGHAKAPNIRLCNAIIKALSRCPEPRMALACFARMRREGVPPDKHTFPSLLKALSMCRNENPFQFCSQIVKFGLVSDRFVQNSLVSAVANCGRVDVARQVFDEMGTKDVIAWTALIDGYVRSGFPVEALKCFAEMKSTSVTVDEMTVSCVLRAAGMMGTLWFGRWVHGFYVVSLSGRVHWDAHVGSALVDMYSTCGYCDDAQKVFEETPCKNVVCWSALITGYAQCNRFRDALIVFENMLVEKRQPNQLTLTIVLTACAQLGALAHGKWAHKYVIGNGLEVNSRLGTALIDMYAKCGCIHEAFLVFEKLPVKDAHLWTAMINGFAIHGNALNSLSLFSNMLNSGVRPNEVTLLGVLSACSRGGLVEEGRKLFGSMNSVHNLEPRVNHYGCIVDLLGRAGYLEEAVKLIEAMPMEPTPGVWGALFNACMIHKAYELGVQVGKRLIKLQPHHSGRYALLANLYSNCQNWEAAAHVRKLMKWKGVEKAPGCSWLELNGLVHEFIAFGNSNVESKDIYLVLDSIVIQSELCCCDEDTDLLMFNVD